MALLFLLHLLLLPLYLVVLVVLLAEVAVEGSDGEAENDAKLNDSDREVSIGLGLLLVNDAALPRDVLHPPALEPLVVSLHRALQLVVAERNLPELAVITDLEGKSAVLLLVNFEDEI